MEIADRGAHLVKAEIYSMERHDSGEVKKEELLQFLYVREAEIEDAERFKSFALEIYQAIMEHSSYEIKLIYRANNSSLVFPLRSAYIKSLEPSLGQQCIMYQLKKLIEHN